MSEFYQVGPDLPNQFDDDALLRDYLSRCLPGDVHGSIVPGLKRLGERVAGEVAALADEAEANPPRLVQFDPWGRRVDRLQVSPAWAGLHAVAAEEGIVATAFERREGPWSRLHQFARLYLYNPSSAIYSCPLAMTDGAARILEHGAGSGPSAKAFTRLTSRDPAEFWTSGQWMTERTGGSDVSGTTTEARHESGRYRLYGTKWFTSAITSQMALALARRRDDEGLSLFYLETHGADGSLNNIRILRLKDKLGTRAMPTAELRLDGAEAELIGKPGRGVRAIGTMLNVTRAYNACCAASLMRRGLNLARSYAQRRQAFRHALIDLPLHAETLARLETEVQAAFHLVFNLAGLLGKEETGAASAEERDLLRLLTPVTKLYTGKQAVAVTSEILECFGGAGYIEDTGLPRLLRDAQVLPIWEGTTNVLSLDVLRVLSRSDALAAFAADVQRRLETVRSDTLAPARRHASTGLDALLRYAAAMGELEPEVAEAGARDFAFGLARVHAGALMLEFAEAGTGQDDLYAAAARRWCAAPLVPDLRRVGAEYESAHRLARGH